MFFLLVRVGQVHIIMPSYIPPHSRRIGDLSYTKACICLKKILHVRLDQRQQLCLALIGNPALLDAVFRNHAPFKNR